MNLRPYLAAAALLVPASLPAQDQNGGTQSAAQPQTQAQPIAEAQAQEQQATTTTVSGEACAGQDQQQARQKRPSFAKDAGTAVAQTGGQIAGAAVAGPIGAAVGGVAVSHVGHAVKKVVKGKKRQTQPVQEQGQPAAQACGGQTGQ